jgi:hypothetical protein
MDRHYGEGEGEGEGANSRSIQNLDYWGGGRDLQLSMYMEKTKSRWKVRMINFILSRHRGW